MVLRKRRFFVNRFLLASLMILSFVIMSCISDKTEPKTLTMNDLTVGKPYVINRFLPPVYPVYVKKPSSDTSNSAKPDFIVWDLNEDGLMDGVARVTPTGEAIDAQYDANFDGKID